MVSKLKILKIALIICTNLKENKKEEYKIYSELLCVL